VQGTFAAVGVDGARILEGGSMKRVLEWYLLTVIIILVAWSALGAFALWVTGGL
jgi:hypothetical protein